MDLFKCEHNIRFYRVQDSKGYSYFSQKETNRKPVLKTYLTSINFKMKNFTPTKWANVNTGNVVGKNGCVHALLLIMCIDSIILEETWQHIMRIIKVLLSHSAALFLGIYLHGVKETGIPRATAGWEAVRHGDEGDRF